MKVTYPTVRLARYTPNRIAVLDNLRTLTYEQLESEIVAYAQRIASCGVQPGDRVVVAASNSIEWTVIVHALARLGAILAPINTRWNASEANGVLNVLSPRLLIADDQCAARLFGDICSDAITCIALGHERPGWRCWGGIESINHPVPDTIELDAVSTIMATSGSSGNAKLVALTYGNHFFSAMASAMHLGHRVTDRWLVNLPLFHIGGLSIVHRAVISGFAAFVQPGFDADATSAAISKHEITHLSLVSTTLLRLLGYWTEHGSSHQLRAVLVGGGATDTNLLHEARRAGFPVAATYGMTETASQVATMFPHGSFDHSCTRARALPLCAVRVCDRAGQRVNNGEIGQVRIQGPMVARGYWGPQGRIRPLLDSGWFVTDDLGTIDTEGRLCVVGRRDDVIVSGGESVSLSEIEQAITRIQGVRRAIVIAEPSAEWGQTPVAFVEADSSVNEATVRVQLRDSIASFKMPSQIMVFESLPETAIGKIDRQELMSRLRKR